MRTRSPVRLALAIGGVLTLTALSGCSVTTPETVAEARTGCAISAPAGFADQSIGQAVLAETELARAAGIFSGTSSQRVPTASTTAAALRRMNRLGCALTMVVGPGGAAEAAAEAADHPDDLYLSVASGHKGFPANVLRVDFDLVSPAFIAGYIAATASETGEVGAVVARGFPQSKKLLDAFDSGVGLYNTEKGEDEPDVVSYRGGSTSNRTVDDTEGAGHDYLRTAVEDGADVIVPFGSAASVGVATAASQARIDAPGKAPAGDQPDGSAADEGGKPAALPKVIWYGTSGGFSEAVIATIFPNVRRGMRAMFPDWPQSKNPDEVPAPPSGAPEEVGGFRVSERHWTGTIDNGGVGITAEDGFLSRVSDAGRSITDLRERIKSGQIDPGK